MCTKLARASKMLASLTSVYLMAALLALAQDSTSQQAAAIQAIAVQQQQASLPGAPMTSGEQAAVSNMMAQAQPQQQQPQPQVQQQQVPQQQQQAQQNPRLPKINLYLNRNEVRKLLGIDNKISYVENGYINDYPFGFTIPHGYNASDIIFNWQNLGKTNVNYSISLVISNPEAVITPWINITRTGLIPKHEQVFKITLPCSGRVTDEVDVQVLISIAGQLPAEELEGPSAAAGELANPQLGAAISAASGGGGPAPALASDEPMQSDQAQQATRLASHILAIKRKKICTQYPVQVPVQPRAPTQTPAYEATVRPPTQPIIAANGATTGAPTQPADIQPQAPPSAARNRWPHEQQQQQQTTQRPPASHEAPQSEQTLARPDIRHAGRLPSNPMDLEQPQPAAIPALYPNWPTNLDRPPVPTPIAPDNPLSSLIGPPPPPPARHLPQNGNGNSPLLVVLVSLSVLVSLALVAVALLGSNSSHQPLDKLNALTSCLLRRSPAAKRHNKCKSPIAGAGIIHSLRAGPKSSASSVSGLSAISGKSLAKPMPYCISGTQIIQPHLQQQTYATYSCAGGQYQAHTLGHHTLHHSGHQPHQQHHHYQQPPTADLLGTGYQCHNNGAAGNQPPPYQIHHINTNSTGQTTRLIWNAGHGQSPDSFTIDGTYMPLSNAPRSESGSAYQSIY